MPFRPLVPRFLKRFDDYLLINRPAAWSARTHLAVWYALLFAVVLTLLCLVVPFDARESSQVFSWVLFIIVIIILGFVVWLIYLLRFNVFKKFGRLPLGYGLMTFFLYAAVIFSFVICAYIPRGVESIRANRAYTNEEIIRDVNMVNIDLCKLERDSLDLEWGRDTSILRPYMPPEDRTTREETVDNVMEDREPADEPELEQVAVDSTASGATVANTITYYTYKDSSELFDKVRHADSLVRPNDSTYIFLNCPDYNFINDFIPDDYSRLKRLSSVEIYHRVLEHYRLADRKAVRRELDSLARKYNTDSVIEKYHFPKRYRFNRSEYINHTQQKYSTYIFGRSMVNISEKKYQWNKGLLSEFLRPLYYIVLIITLLVFIFRHTTVKTFFLSILTAVLLLILTALAFALLAFREEHAVFWVMLFYFLVFAVVAFTIGMSRVRRAWKGIALNLAVFFLPYMPLIVVSQYYSYLRERYMSYMHPEKFQYKELHLLLAEIGGFLLLLILLEPVIRPLYRKWYSQPEQ